jgi:hypothetical protein
MPEQLISLARQRIVDGTLSAEPSARTSGGLSRGGICSVCSAVITPNSLEIVAEFKEGSPLLFHPSCFAAWWSAIDQGAASRQQVT